MAVTAPGGATAQGEILPGRPVRASDFVRLKVRLLRNGFRGQGWRIALYVIGAVIGLWIGFACFAGIAATGLGRGEHGRDLAGGVADRRAAAGV